MDFYQAFMGIDIAVHESKLVQVQNNQLNLFVINN